MITSYILVLEKITLKNYNSKEKRLMMNLREVNWNSGCQFAYQNFLISSFFIDVGLPEYSLALT